MSLIDRWASLDFKAVLGRTASKNITLVQQPWVGEHKRRLQAYDLLASYVNNVSRNYRSTLTGLSLGADDTAIPNFDPVARTNSSGYYSEYREYADASLISEQTLAALLGDTQTVVVPGAAEAREAGATEPEKVAALLCETYLRKWWEKEMMQLKVIEVEEDAVTLGDGVYVLGWDSARHRTRARVYDPACYFPILDPEDDDDFPKRVHIAYEFETDNEDKDVPEKKNMIRRITWELKDGTCYMTDATWEANRTGPSYSTGGGLLRNSNATVDRFSLASATIIRKEKEDLKIPMIPVVHIPNTVAGAEHYGISILSKIAQILDDLQNVDTDLQKAAATTATPPIALVGSRVAPKSKAATTGALNYNPGDIWELEAGGDMKILDTSKSLDALLKLAEYLQKRLSSNARLPEALLGKVDPSKAPSGLAIALTFGPLVSMIGQMRMVRRYKYGLLFKFVLQMAISARENGDNDPSLRELPEDLEILTELPKLEFGNFMPTDLAETVTNVVALLGQKAITVETGLKMLQNAGIPIVSITEEAQRLREVDFAAAKNLFDAAGGDVKVVGDFLGITIEKPPAPVQSSTPGANTGTRTSTGSN
jgi:hypothetical protein